MKYKPVDRECKQSKRNRLESGTKEVERRHAQIDAETALDEILEKMSHQLSRDRVHANDDKRKRQTGVFFDVHDP